MDTRSGVERAVARASQAYAANEVALDDSHLHAHEHENGHVPEEHSVHGHLHGHLHHVQASAKSARELRHVKSAKNLRTAAAVTVNLRDCGAVSRILRQGRMFRSSQVMRQVSFSYNVSVREGVDLFKH